MSWNPNRPPLKGRVVVVAGQCSKVGKTTLVVNLIRTFSDVSCTAVKITPYVSSGCPINGPNCRCGPDEHTFSIRNDRDTSAATDTSRFLAAGAQRALSVETKEGRVPDALGALASVLRKADPIVIESNAILQFWRPALCLMVLDPQNPDFKPTVREVLPMADVFVIRSARLDIGHPDSGTLAFPQKPIFLQIVGQPLPPSMQALIRQHMRGRVIPL